MNGNAFEAWRDELLSLDRYENAEDARQFSTLVKGVIGKLDAKTIDVLLDTFCDDDDYGIQERVLVVLDHADATLYAERLATNFAKIKNQASDKEWPLILIGRMVNSENDEKINAIVLAAKKHKSFDDFIRSDEFLDEYPELTSYIDDHLDR
ncbi:hypothetical protein [Pectobacterium peruviense]|uniref:Immunity protein 30 domain-containing protein n=1 Tax=Pectobacterium peruviense TaxID=2066479 RepID=A0ABX4SBN4_9GAMM|nr:hypothetical protein [Pectobacterium peruviense]KML70788.1 hypothetical protein G033_02335 [Pectobacterium peruviense]PKX82697.1 hypothetical protein A0G02_13230 [Pectobacterium peruviense]PKX87138.1 hypothetical protein A0G03_06730 [Pectobacterium peruviense]